MVRRGRGLRHRVAHSPPLPVSKEMLSHRRAPLGRCCRKSRKLGSSRNLAKDILCLPTLLQASVKIGRSVRNYDDGQWSAARFDLVVAGNIAKFGQNPPLREHLLGSDDAILVEAAPRDTIWGIGLGRENPAAHDPLRWRGLNLLGFALVKVRASLRGELVSPKH
jgi:ribA/ribD-fused uncharacterized protein